MDSLGLSALAHEIVEAGVHDVVVAAPRWDSSGTVRRSPPVQVDGQLLSERRRLDALSGIEVYAAEAAPAFIVRTAVEGAFGQPPDVVLSGINAGLNLGHSVLHSGTVGAALTASTDGGSGIAVSLASGRPRQWQTAARVARQMLPWLIADDDGVVLNVNVPNVAPDELRGV